jgi:hypothetical protein
MNPAAPGSAATEASAADAAGVAPGGIAVGVPALHAGFPARLLPRPILVAVVLGLLGVGLAVRVLPLAQGRDLLLRQPSEDGYLMLTVARNMAVGLGMSTAAGTIPTNGVQPLATGLFAAGFFVARGDKTVGVAWVMWLSVLISLAAAWAVFRLGRVVFAGRDDADELSMVAAAAWFASPIVVSHSMNALETGIYFLVLALAMRVFLIRAADPDRDLSWREAVGLGGWLGLAFLARNDAIFLAAAMGLARLGLAWGRPAAVRVRRGRELALAAGVMAALAAPWMISNFVRFGSIVPISGKAEAAERLGENLPTLPAKLAEFVSVVGAIPNPLEPRPPVALACAVLVLLAVGAALAVFRRGSPRMRAAALLGLIHGGILALYYGAFFGAPHFLSRYTSPVSILCALLTVGLVLTQLKPLALRIGVPLLMGAVALVLDVRVYKNSHEHMHFQVVDWVDRNVPAEAWVGAIQSGTLGFFHDRTINLDGKTNPAALKARGPERMRPYILATPIAYLADWSGIAAWESFLAPDFEVVVDDPALNLGVLKKVR